MKKIGLALGSGSMKGLAHIGVLQVLKENNIPISILSGSSMGSVIGAIYACGPDLYLLEKYVEVINLFQYLDLSNPIVKGGMISGDKIEEIIKVLTHFNSFEDLPIPFFCVATNLNKGERHYFNSGPLHSAIRASISIPGIFNPTNINGEIYVDGGVMETVPCNILKENGAEIVIGVDVSYQGQGFTDSKYSGISIIHKSMSIMQNEINSRRRNEADIWIIPEVQFVKGTFNNSSAELIIKKGREKAEEMLPSILEAIQ